MASSSSVVMVMACIVLSCLLAMSFLQMADATTPQSPQSQTQGYHSRPINCPAECRRRCSKARMSDKCYSCCIPCCHKCSCVPPGTYGNKQMCSCYNNLKNSKNGVPKCP